MRERVIVALSLNKAFSAAGGALLLPDPHVLGRIRRCGGPMLFSGPVQPPMLGAAVASARLHLDPSFARLQAALMGRIDYAAAALERAGLPRASTDRTPVCMLPCDSPNIVFETVERLRELGFYASPCLFPAVPINHPGVRYTITSHNTLEDIDDFVNALAKAFHTANMVHGAGRTISPPAAESSGSERLVG